MGCSMLLPWLEQKCLTDSSSTLVDAKSSIPHGCQSNIGVKYEHQCLASGGPQLNFQIWMHFLWYQYLSLVSCQIVHIVDLSDIRSSDVVESEAWLVASCQPPWLLPPSCPLTRLVHFLWISLLLTLWGALFLDLHTLHVHYSLPKSTEDRNKSRRLG